MNMTQDDSLKKMCKCSVFPDKKFILKIHCHLIHLILRPEDDGVRLQFCSLKRQKELELELVENLAAHWKQLAF